MFNKTLADQAIHNADIALEGTQNVASQAIDSVGRAMDNGMDRMRATSQQMRDSAARVSIGTANYIRHDPVKSVLIAAATGAALMALASLVTRSNNRH